MDFDDLLLGPQYAATSPFACDAHMVTRAGDEYDLRVIDEPNGIEVALGELSIPTRKPAASVRMAELSANGLGRDDVRDAQLTMNDVRWRVRSTWAKGSPQGETKGEIYLLLEPEPPSRFDP